MGARYSTRRRPGLGADADDRDAFPDQIPDGGFLHDPRAFFAGVVQQHLVELRAEDLPGLGDGVAVVTVEEIKRLAGPARRGRQIGRCIS